MVIRSAFHPQIIELNSNNLNIIDINVGRAKHTVLKVFSIIQSKPIIDITHTSELIGKTFRTTSKAISILVELGILKKVEQKERYQVFAYEDYLNILREGTEVI